MVVATACILRRAEITMAAVDHNRLAHLEEGRLRNVLVAATENGQALAGVVEMKCGDADPIRLYAFSCGNGAVDPGESCDDGNQVPGDGCDARCVTE